MLPKIILPLNGKQGKLEKKATGGQEETFNIDVRVRSSERGTKRPVSGVRSSTGLGNYPLTHRDSGQLNSNLISIHHVRQMTKQAEEISRNQAGVAQSVSSGQWRNTGAMSHRQGAPALIMQRSSSSLGKFNLGISRSQFFNNNNVTHGDTNQNEEQQPLQSTSDLFKHAKLALETGRNSTMRESSSFQRKHSYKVFARPQQVKILEKIREEGLAAQNSSSFINSSQTVPELVQRQTQLKKDGDPISPFLVQERTITPRVIKRAPQQETVATPKLQTLQTIQDDQVCMTERSPIFIRKKSEIGSTFVIPKTPLKTLSTIQRNFAAGAKSVEKNDFMISQAELNQSKTLDRVSQRKKYLPIDAYDPLLDEEKPHQLIEQYKDKDTGLTLALSKWFFSQANILPQQEIDGNSIDNRFEMRQCEVIRYIDKEELYEVRWLCNGSFKKVVRFNLIFVKEDQEAFLRRLAEAERMREQAELIMKYQFMIQKTKIPHFALSDDEKTRISYMIHTFKPSIKDQKYRNPELFNALPACERYTISKASTLPKIQNPNSQELISAIHQDFKKNRCSLKTLASLFGEVDQQYGMVHKQIEFEKVLPYSVEMKQTFRNLVAPEKFTPVQDRGNLLSMLPERKGLIEIPDRSQPFSRVLATMQKKLHQASQEKLESLIRVHANMVRLEPMNFFKIRFNNRYSTAALLSQNEGGVLELSTAVLLATDTAQPLEMFMRANRVQASEVLREVRNCMFDAQYEVNSMVAREQKRIRDLNEERKRAASCQSQQQSTEIEVISDKFIAEIGHYQCLLNTLYERSVRECFERSITILTATVRQISEFMSDSVSLGKDTKCLENPNYIPTELQIMTVLKDAILTKKLETNAFQWKMSFKFTEDENMIKLSPSPQQWIDEFISLVTYNVDEISFVACFEHELVGSAREERKIRIFSQSDPYVQRSVDTLRGLMQGIFKIPLALESLVQQYSHIMAIDIKAFKKEYKTNDYSIEKQQDQLKSYQHAKHHVERLLFENRLQCGMLLIRGDHLRKQFVAKVEELNKVLFSCIKKKMVQTNALIEAEVEGILKVINKEPLRDIEEVSEVQSFLDNLPKKQLQKIRSLIQDAMSKMGLLEQYQCKLTEEEFSRTWRSFSNPIEIFKAEAECRKRLKRDEKEFFSDLRIMIERLQRDFEELKIDFEILQRSDDLRTDYDDAVIKCDNLYDKLERAIEIAEVANRREGLFNLKKSDFCELETFKERFLPFNTLWNLARDYFYKSGHWMNGPLGDIDRDKIPQEINDACQTLLKLERVNFKERKSTAMVCSDLRKLYESFKPYLPLIIALRNPSLKLRHWENLQNLRNPLIYELESEMHASIFELVERCQIMDIVEEINDISDCASREKKLEDAIQKMKDEWRFIKFQLAEYRESGTYVIKGAEPFWDMLDDHIMKTMTIASSPYIKFLQSEVNYWKYTLVRVQEILEEWTKTQRGWLYLWPIFSSEDIQRQMPLISGSFMSVDKLWRNLMQSTYQNSNVLDACLQARLFEHLQQCNDSIDRIQKGLNDYLHTKRLSFPRFFFLSNDDLLHILSQTKDPLRVQDHLNKCFEGIEKLRFEFVDDGNAAGEVSEKRDEKKISKILGMYSNLDEYLPFPEIVEPFHLVDNQVQVKNIEDWLGDVETQMRESLRVQVRESSAEYDPTTRSQWIFKWASQVVLTLDQVIWTQSIEKDGIMRMDREPSAMKRMYQREEAKLLELVELIKEPRENAAHVMTLGALIVLDVHSKDVTRELALANVKSLAEFDWISQLRYYIVSNDGQKQQKTQGSPDINVKMVNTTRLYGYEYLGNQTRLVITPLTDRCYRTLMGALQLNLGGAPEGPAGTGKTETTKDLAKAVAKQCIVFNCSDQLNVESMAKFFKGLACCGGWACFDEFNRIELEVLSVIAQQILTIQAALMRRRPNTPFMFDGEELIMNASCAVFITMNPGYAGRSELPDNLKALFRPVAMMIPNYAMIAEISLYSFGFQNARELSVKITSSLKLASEQLSTQSHYDYGMRAVKSIILAAGSLKRKHPEEEESRLTLRAISDCNIPKFLSDDIPLFEGIISDLFPTTDKSKPLYESLISSLKRVMQASLLQPSPEFQLKSIQLYETIQVRHGLMLVGGVMSGKSTIVNTLANALEKKVKVQSMNPKSVTIGQLYGDFDKISHDWSDGVLAAVIKESAQDKSGALRWIMLDGPVDAVWIENLNTVLDDNKKLCLSSGEIVKFTPQMTMMFEVEDLLEASPATVSRCGMVYMNPEKLVWQVQTETWLQKLPTTLSNPYQLTLLRKLLDFFMPLVTDFLFGTGDSSEEDRLSSLQMVIPATKNWIYSSFLSLLESLLLKQDTRDSISKRAQEAKDKEEAKAKFEQFHQNNINNPAKTSLSSRHQSNFEGLSQSEEQEITYSFIMSLAWSYGSLLDLSGRSIISNWIYEQFTRYQEDQVSGQEVSRQQIPRDIYSYFFHTEKQAWLRWDYDLDTQNQSGHIENDNEDSTSDMVEFSSIVIPTEDTIRYTFLLKSLTHHSFPAIFVGETGTGKTSTIKKFVTQLSADEWETGQMVFSATATSNQVQNYIQSRLEKQRKGIYGPKVPGHKLIIFVDDLNMPAKEKYGAQPPIEILRQTIDQGGYYDLKTNEMNHLVNVIFVGAMGITSGGGKNLPSCRLLRHFSIFNIPQFTSENLFRIFSKILDLAFTNHPQSWQKQINNLTQLTIQLYEKAVQVLLPLPSKNHYSFNLRQVSELIQGLTLVPHEIVSKIKDEKKQTSMLVRLWVHESMRVFSDRLVNEEDKELFVKALQDSVISTDAHTRFLFERSTNSESANILMNPGHLIFTNFVHFDQFEPVYQESQSLKDLEMSVLNIIDQYNSQAKEGKLPVLLIFDYMLEHLSRISRILSKPSNGHGLLIGLGGNGRKTLAKLAAFINTCQIYKVDISGGASSNKGGYSRYDWQEDIKNMNKTMGIDNKKVAFHLSDSEIKGDYFMEDISSLLNVGEVHNIYTQDEVDEVIFEIQKTVSKKKLIGSAGSESALLDLFKQRCRKNLHLLLFMSPAGPTLRNYIRQYPALVNCTTIDWFLNWPESALQKVAHHFLSKQDEVFQFRKPQELLINGEMIESDLSPEDLKYNKDQIFLRDRVSQVFVQLHSSVINLANEFQLERNRLVYITPTRFTNNFTLFHDILLRKLKQIDEERNTYLMGIHKLEEANMIVDGMKAQLEDLKPILDLKSKEVEKIMINLDKETKEVESIKAIVDIEAQAVYEQKEIAEGIKNECQERLSEAQPLLDAALNALRTLNVKDFVIMKSFNTPPAPIKLALEAACIMLGIAPKIIEGPVDKATKKPTKIADFWEKSKKLLNDYKKFLNSLEHYDKDFIPDDRIHKIQEYLHNPKFVPEEIRKASEAAEGICKWVIAITKYDIIAKEIRPKCEALGLAQGKLDIVLGKLREKEAELKKIRDQKQGLEEEFARQNYEKSRLIAQRDECQAKLNRAGILMGSLGVEKERWIRSAERLLREKQSIIGDVILAAASINYLGAFEGSYRENVIKRDWRIQLQNQAIPLGDEFNLKQVVGNVQKLQAWQLKGLPQDSVSVENMIILEETKAFKWPIIVDPQGYALKFLKEYLENDFIQLKLQQERFTKKLEQALFQGGTVVLEGFTENFDASLSSIIFKDVQEVKGERYIKYNDNHIELNEKFKLYLICSQANPHFSPDVHSKMTPLNFSVTREGLEQQLLSVVCRNESVRDEDEKERLLRQNIEFQENKRQVEEQILEQLRNSGAEILDDDTLVNSLNESKKITDDIKHKLQSAKIVEDRIEENRRHFKPVAVLAAKLYFALQEMAQLDPMYQFSMKYYRELFIKSFTVSDKVKEIKGRVRQLKSDFLKVLYSNVCNSLFEKHKLMFAFNMAIKVHLDDGHSSGDEKRDLFNKKLKELEMLQHHSTLGNQDKSQHGGGGPISVISGNQKSGLNINTLGKLTISKKSIIDRKSDNSSQTGIQSMINQRNEEERLRITKNEQHYLLTGLVSQDVEVEDRPNTCDSFIDSKTWQQVCELSTLESFESLPDDMEKNQAGWKKFIQKSYEPVPEPYSTQIPEFAQILLHKVLKPEKTVQMIQRYVQKAFGQNFLKPAIQTLEEIYNESKPHIPIILILTPGNDPMEQIKKLGEEKQKIPYPVSLGKGQGEKAKALINETRPFGGWVMLQNCHLSSSFLPELEQIIQSLQPSNFNQANKKGEQEGASETKKELKPPHQDFRLWLTSMSTDTFPISILQDSIKLTSEPPKGLKPSLIRIYNQIDQSKVEKEFFNTNTKPNKWKKLFLALSFFHGIVRERRSYGSLGWNLNYDFNDSDFRISQRQLHLMIDTFDEVPFRALRYLTGECNYGGRVTDDWDRRTLQTILKDFYNEAVLVDYKYQFIAQPNLAKDYYIQQSEDFHDFNDYVQALPDEESPQLFGLHPNASITQAINDSSTILKNILSISQTSQMTQQSSQGNLVYIKMANEILTQVRDQFKIKEVEKQYPFRYEESMNSVLLQELARFNNLIEVIKNSLHTLIKTLEGKVLMTADFERLQTSIANNNVPDMWKARSYPSKKPLMSYIKDLRARLKMLEEWIEKRQPNVFWISGFFFTQSFLTGVKQNFARKYQYPIDKVTFKFQVFKHEEHEKIERSPDNGCLTTGLYLEGASWNDQEGVLQESEPKVLFTKMPLIHFIPELEKEVTIEVIEGPPQISLDNSLSSIEEAKPRVKYQCPVYKTSDRAGTLSTTGHSTNYILTAILASNDPEDLWIKRSVALIASLND